MKETVDFSKLISDAANGDESACNEIYRLTHKTAYCTASLLLKNPDDVQDVLQNAYLKAFQKLPELKNPESLESWIKSIVENETKNYIKKEKRFATPSLFLKNKIESNSDEWKEPVPQEIMERDELRKSVCKILDSLSSEIRACIVLFHFEEKNLNEISDILGIPLGTVKSRLHNGRKQIEKEFNKLQKKDPTLYGIGAIPVLLSVLAYQTENIAVPATITEAVAATTAVGSAGVSATAGTTAATTATVSTTAVSTGAASASAAGAIAVKVAAVAVAGTVAVGGGVAVVNHIENKTENKITTAYSSTLLSEEYTTAAQIAVETSTKTSTETSASSSASTTQTEARLTSVTVIQTSARNSATSVNTTRTETTTKKETTTKTATTKATTTKPSTTAKPTTTVPPTTNPENNYGASGGVITEYSGEETDVSIPSSIDGDTVTAIGAGAFSGNTDIESVSLPSTVTQIGQEAFADCRYLSDISMPSSLEQIGVGAFYGCSNLTSVDIPSGTKTIGDEAFAQCSRLKTIKIPSSVTSISDDAFDGCDALTIKCEEGSAAHSFAVENGINYKII